MKEYFLNSQELFDVHALELLNKEEIPGLLPCFPVKWNERIQLVYSVDGLTALSLKRDELDIDDYTRICSEIIETLVHIENNMDISAENVSWDMDNIYLDEDNEVYLICLPAVLPLDVLESRIYIKRVYALMDEIMENVEGAETVIRQMEAARTKGFGDWQELKEAFSARIAAPEETITLKSINTPTPFTFEIGHEDFYIGTDPDSCKGCILGAISVSPVHALIGWNEVSFFIQDLGSREGTYLNDIRIAPQAQIPFGKGSVIRFAECTFNVE